MNKKIVFVIFISTSILLAGCGNKQVKPQSLNNTDNSITNSKPESANQQTTSNTAPNTPTASLNSSTNDYAKYTGTWVTENNLKNDYKYGIVIGINVDKDGNIQGQVSNLSNNLSHISNVDIKGKIQNNKFMCNFDEDGWGHSGTIELDFKESKIALTINYNPSSSKDTQWEIGQGTFTLINNNTKVARTLDNLKAGGLQVIESQCFSVNLENYGRVKFISGLKREDYNNNANFYLVDDKNNVLYKFPDFYGNTKGMFNDIRAVSFVDVNNDGLKEIVIISDYKSNTSSSTLIPICSIYFQKGKEFINYKNIDDRINNSSNNKDIATVLKYAKENLFK